MSHQDPPSPPPGLGVQRPLLHPDFHMGPRDLNSSPRACPEGTSQIDAPSRGPDSNTLAWYEGPHGYRDTQSPWCFYKSLFLSSSSSSFFSLCSFFPSSRFVWNIFRLSPVHQPRSKSLCSTPSVPSKMHDLGMKRTHRGHPALRVQN